MHPFIGRAISLHPCLVIYTFERLSCEARMEKLSALNFRLVSPETWKSWHWVSGNQELPPDFHLQSWQKFRTLLKAGNIWSTWNYNFPFLALIYISLHDWTMELIRVQGNISLEAENRACCLGPNVQSNSLGKPWARVFCVAWLLALCFCVHR